MRTKLLFGTVAGLVLLAGPTFANMDYNVDEKIQKMKTELNLTDAQANAVKPILEEFKSRKEALKEGPDKNAFQKDMMQLKMEKEQKLSQVLTSEQMGKLRSMKDEHKAEHKMHKKESSGT